MAEQVIESIAPPPRTLPEYRERKAASATGSPAPPAEKQASAAPEGETAGTSAIPNKESQESGVKQGKPKAKNAEERAAELRAAGRVKEADKILADDADQKEYERYKATKADRERDAEELRELRTRKPPEAAAPVVPQAAAPAAVPSDKPKLKEYLEKPENKDRPYDDVLEQWEDAVSAWRQAKSKAENEANERKRTFDQKIEEVRKAHPDYDALTSGENFQRTLLTLNPLALRAAAYEIPSGVNALYALARDAAECRRVSGLSPTGQIIELGIIARASVEAPTATPEPQKPIPISRTPPPARNLGGISPSEATPKGPPTSLPEYRARKAARGN